MKKLFVALASVGSSVVALAEGTAAETIVGTDDVTGIFEAAQTNMEALIDAALPVAIAFVGGGLVIWGALALVSILKRAFGAGKGR